MTAWVQKYRPKTFSKVLGNGYLIEKLIAMIQADKFPQNLMFVGDRGIGKTTLARILAKTLLCPHHQEGESCNVCTTCQTLDDQFIEKGRIVQGIPIYQYDITKFNKREDIARIVERIEQRLLHNQKTVFILDEIQRATPEAQSCFLKVVEEPPPNVHIILCTTNPEKLITPLRSRFHQLRVRKPSPTELSNRLREICLEEHVNFSNVGIEIIARRFENIPREAINMLEFIALTGEVIKDTVYKELQLVKEQHYLTFFDACMKGNLTYVIQIVETLQHEERIDISTFIEGLGRFLTDMLKIRAGIGNLHYTVDEIKQMRSFIRRFSDKQIADMLQIIQQSLSLKEVSEFTLTTIAVQITEILVQLPDIHVPTEQEVGMMYREVTEQVQEQLTRRTFTEIQSGTTDDLRDIFGNIQQVRTS